VLVVHNLSRETRTVALGADTHVASVLLQSKSGVVLAHGQLNLPPYATAILQ